MRYGQGIVYQRSAKKYQIFEFTEDEVEKIIPPGRNRCKNDTPDTLMGKY
jgi:hypothetical protein